MSITPPATPDPDKMPNSDKDQVSGQDSLPQIMLNGFTPSPSVSPPSTAMSSHYASSQQTPTRNTTPSFGGMLTGLGISGVETVEVADDSALEGMETEDKTEGGKLSHVTGSDEGTPSTISGLSHASSTTQAPTNFSSPASPFTTSRRSNTIESTVDYEGSQHTTRKIKKKSPPSPTDLSGIVMERFQGLSPNVDSSTSDPPTDASRKSLDFLDPFGHTQAGTRLSSPFNPSSGQLQKQSSPLRDSHPWVQNFSPERATTGSNGSLSSPPPLSPPSSSSPSRANSSVSYSRARRSTNRSSLTRTPPSSGKTSTFPTVVESDADGEEYAALDTFEDPTSPARKWKAQIAVDDEAEEGRNSLPDLPFMPATPNRYSFTFPQQPHPRYSPIPHLPAEQRSSLGAPLPGGQRLSATSNEFIIPPSPTITPSWQHGRSDSVVSNHDDGHRVHARNLSLFFPRPDANGIVPAPVRSPSLAIHEHQEAPVTLIMPKDQEEAAQYDMDNHGFSLGLPPPPRNPSISVGITGDIDIQGQHKTVDPSKKRRGHHHRHSMSHNFFSFLDPTVTNPALSGSGDVLTNGLEPPLSAKPILVASTLIQGSDSGRELNASSISLLPSLSTSHKRPSLLAKLLGLSPRAQLKAGVGLLELFLGVSFWIDGQVHGNVSMTGLGYMVVFDAMGLLLQVWGGFLTSGIGAQSTISNPFGSHRRETLYYFVQAIFLLFAATYIAKESLEHMLTAGDHSHGGQHRGHGSHEHGAVLLNDRLHIGKINHRSDTSTFLLLVAGASTMISGAFLQNHRKMVQAVGPFLWTSSKGAAVINRVQRLHPAMGSRLERYLDNPFSAAVSICCIAALVAHSIVPVDQTDLLEKALALAETILAFWLAYPASVAFGKVLLQTAPPQDTVQMLALKKAIREVEAHPSVTRVSRPHVWQLTPHNPRNKNTPVTPVRPRAISRATSHYNRTERSEKSIRDKNDSAGSSILVANIVIHLRPDVESRKVLEVTRLAFEAFDNAVGIRKSSDKWAFRGGELSVMVMRGEKKPIKRAHAHHHDHHHEPLAGCDHGHQAHGHSQEAHGPAHSHSHHKPTLDGGHTGLCHHHTKEIHQHRH